MASSGMSQTQKDAHKELWALPWYRILALFIVTILAGCATGPQVPAVVKVPVPISCIHGDPPAKPDTLSEAEILVMDDYAATLTVWTERMMLKSYAVRAEAIILGCK